MMRTALFCLYRMIVNFFLEGLMDGGMISATIFMIYTWPTRTFLPPADWFCCLVACVNLPSPLKKWGWWRGVAIHRLSFGDHILSYSVNFHSLLAYPCEVLKSFQNTIIILPLVLSLGKLCAKKFFFLTKLCWLCFSCVRMTYSIDVFEKIFLDNISFVNHNNSTLC